MEILKEKMMSNYQDAYFINASSKQAPGIIDQNKIRLTDSGTIVSGDYIRASINLFPFNTNGNKGIAVGLNNIQLVERRTSWRCKCSRR